jgi:hypothetical protein
MGRLAALLGLPGRTILEAVMTGKKTLFAHCLDLKKILVSIE